MEVRKIPNYSNYLAYEDGRIWSKISGIFMKTQNSHDKRVKNGVYYQKVGLVNDSGTQRKVSVHSVICTAFHGRRPDGYECDHINGIRNDNRACNLEWVTPQENARRMGILSRKYLSPEDERRIDELYESYPVTYIAKKLNCSPNVIKNSLVSRGIFDGRVNRIHTPHSKISEVQKRDAIRLYKTGKFTRQQIVDILELPVNKEALGYYFKDLESQSCYRDKAISEYYILGWKIDYLSKVYSVSKSYIKSLLKGRGILRNEDVFNPLSTAKITDINKLKALINEGCSKNDIAEKFCCGVGAVDSALKRYCLKTNPKYFKRKYNYAEIYEMNKTMTQTEIANKLGITQPNVALFISKYKRENGITKHGNVMRHAEKRG